MVGLDSSSWVTHDGSALPLGTINGMRYQAPRGTHDVLPDESHLWHWVEGAFRQIATSYGYREIRTPMFEDIEVFIRSSGETSDVVDKEMYDFVDKGGRHIALKPENTAPAIRAYLEHHLGQTGQTSRLYYISPIFRYGRPQKGRLRQHHQCGLELIGSPFPTADAEIIEATVRFYQSLGLTDTRVLLNSIGREECRARYREVVLTHFAGYLKERDSEVQAKAFKNPLRLLDLKDPEAQELTKSVPSILNYLEPASAERFDELQRLLTAAGIDFHLDPGIVRGLDYYTDTVFEVQSVSLGAQSSLCGGGRYDGLVQQLGGPSTPAVGVGMGIERALIVLQDRDLAPKRPLLDAFVATATASAQEEARSLSEALRELGKATVRDLDGKSLKSQLKDADRSGARFVVILGDDEVAGGYLTVRNMLTSEQGRMSKEEFLALL